MQKVYLSSEHFDMMANQQHCLQTVCIPHALTLYEAPLDIELVKNSCFVRDYKVQVSFISLGSAKAFKPDKLASFIICYNQTHACVLSRDTTSNAAASNAFVVFDSLQFSELTQYLSNNKKLAPLGIAEEGRFMHESLTDAAAAAALGPVQLDAVSCLPFALVYIHLRAAKELGHAAAIRKLSSFRHHQVREIAFALLGIFDSTRIVV